MDRQVTPPGIEATPTTTDLLVSYPGKHFALAKSEIVGLLQHFGDPEPWVEKTSVWGIAAVHPGLDNRVTIQRCRALWRERPQLFRFTLKWVPVDYWCASSVPEIQQLIARELSPRMGADERWAMRLHKRRMQNLSTAEIIRTLAAGVPGKVDLSHPDRIIWIDIVGRGTAVSLLHPDEIFAPLAHE